MLNNYFKIAFRNLWRNKGFSAINIFGLAIGLATCLLITLFVTDELSYDRYNKKADRIYRINADFLVNGNFFNERFTPSQFGAVLIKDYPQIENYVRFTRQGDILVQKGDETLVEHNASFADSSLFEVFTLPLIKGDPRTALTQPHTMVISESMAKKYFNSTNIIGQSLLTDNTNPYTITGVIKDVPPQSHLHFDFIRSMSELDESRATSWMYDNWITYVLVRPGTSQQTLDGYLRDATKKYMDISLKHMVGSSVEELEKNGGHFRYTAIPLTGIHLHSTLTNEVEPSGDIQYVYIFIVIAVIILLIACVNFMNLSTARSAGRSKEVGIRKVLGSQRSGLILQFLAESVLMSFFALLLALLMAWLLLPYLNQLSGKSIQLTTGSSGWLLAGLPLTVLFVGLLAGSYPAFFLSAFEPVKVLKGRLSSGFKGSRLRNSLVVFQFATAILLMVGTIVIYNQLNYIRNRKLGYNRDQVLVLKNTAALDSHARAFKEEVLQIRDVEAGTMTGHLPTSLDLSTSIYSKDAAHSAGQVTGLGEWAIDADYVPTFGMTMAAGRNFSPQLPTDSSAILLNETAARLFGFTDIRNKYLYQNKDNPVALHVIGIIKDFNAGSLRHQIPPLVFRLAEDRSAMAFRVNTSNLPAVIAQIRKKYESQETMKGQPLTYSFLDEDFDHLYQSEQRTGKIFISFAVFAILIACLGLFGLVTYAAEQRTREIGIRKVLGSSVTGIVRLLSKDFLRLVALAFVIAAPIAWFLMNKWLEDFAYRTTIHWWIFLLAGFLAFLITLLTVGFRAIRAAVANPVHSLRAE